MPNAIDANVFYVGTDNQRYSWSYDGSTKSWTNFPLWEKSALGARGKPPSAYDGVAASWVGGELNVFFSAAIEIGSENQMYSWSSPDGIHWTSRQLT